MRTILSIIPYGLTAHDFFEMREPIKDKPTRHFFKTLPEWCIREDGFVSYTEEYHQWTGTIDSKEKTMFRLFDINPVDEILKEEISQVGVEYLFEGYNWKKMFEKIPINEVPHKSLRIPFNIHVVVDLIYSGDGEDCELDVEVLGFLNGDMDLFRV